MKNEFAALYDKMANSNDVKNMHVFGEVHKEMMEWMIHNRPTEAQEWIEKLSSIGWNNFLTQREAEKIVSSMNPKAPWSREMWRMAMGQHGLPLAKEPCYNSCALWATMSMIMSDSSETLRNYIDEDTLFKVVHDLAVDKLTDKDEKFNVRSYFNL